MRVADVKFLVVWPDIRKDIQIFVYFVVSETKILTPPSLVSVCVPDIEPVTAGKLDDIQAVYDGCL